MFRMIASLAAGCAAVGLMYGGAPTAADDHGTVYRKLEIYRPTIKTNDVYFFHPAGKPALKYNHDVDIVRFKGRYLAAWNANAKPAEGVPGPIEIASPAPFASRDTGRKAIHRPSGVSSEI